MRFSRDWIAAYTELPGTDEDLVEALSGLGLVVDAAERRGGDLILDLDIAANRPDVMNHVAVARELAIARDTTLRPPPEGGPGAGPPTSTVAELVVEDVAGCPRFLACAVLDVTIGESPPWLRERLESIGLRPINSVVDVTNFVMWELGRPLHAYDLDRLAGHALRVRRARAGERLQTLDEVDRPLDPEDLVIADAERPVGLAGVMGGEHTGVTESTRRVLLECACFDPGVVRAMARRHGMHTDASHRFERGLSPRGLTLPTLRAASLIAEVTGGQVAAEPIDARGELPEPVRIRLARERVGALLGTDVGEEHVLRILRGLGFDARLDEGTYALEVPPQRLDVTRPVDVIEEIARFHGYQRIPDTLPVLRRAARSGAEPVLRDAARLRHLCSALGYWEAMTWVFTTEKAQRPFLDDEELIALANPLNELMAVLRGTLVPGLLAAVARNRNVGATRVWLFELGRAFREGAGGGAPIERRRLALVASGEVEPRHFASPSRELGFVDLKGTIESLAKRMGWPELEWHTAAAPGYQEGSVAELRCGPARGVAGRVAPAAVEALGLEGAIWAAEIDVDDLLGRPREHLRVEPPPRYPASDRDVSLLVDASTLFASVEREVAAVAGIPLESLELLDVYRGDDLPAGKLAMTLRLTYRSRERTLTAEEVESAHESVVARLEGAIGAARR